MTAPTLAPAVTLPPRNAVRRLRRLWCLPLRAHLAALAVVLLAVMPLIGTASSFSADEGAAIVQARSLARGDGWIVSHPVPEADPTGAAYPLELSERGAKGTAPFAKHPLYALLLAGADRAAGMTGMVLFSVLGTVAAAGLAALLARRLDPAIARPTLWAVGVASPLFFDGYLVIAHALGAAAAAAAVLAAAAAFERRRPAVALAVAPCMVAAVLLRTEAVFVALGLALAVATVVGAGARRDRLIALLVAGGSLMGAAVGKVGEGAWVSSIVGRGAAGTGPTNPVAGSGFLADRRQAFVLTWLRPSYDARHVVDLLLVLMLAALVLGAYTVRRGRPGAAAMVASAGASAVAALVLAPGNVVPGLLVACPLIAAGSLLLGRDTFGSATARLAAVTSAVYAACVLATQYSTGGSGEWGGRYFALALPLAVPVLVLAVRNAGCRPLVVGLVVCSLAMGVMAVGSLRSTHRFGAALVAAVDRAAGPDRPVVVTTAPLMPRLAWPTFDHQRWLLSRPDDLGDLVGRLRGAGVTRFTFVAQTGTEVARLPAGVATEASTDYHGWRILVVRTAS